jgi:hypothetical protein
MSRCANKSRQLCATPSASTKHRLSGPVRVSLSCFTTTLTVRSSAVPSNKIVKNQLDLEINKINLGFSQFNEYHVILRELNENLKEIEAIRKDPENYIHEYFRELTRQVDLRRETLIEDIHKYSDELIQKIEKLKQECLAKSRVYENFKEHNVREETKRTK